jgi:hypothetical protein
MAEFRVFIAESNNPLDFYLGRLDGHAANEVLKVRRIPSLYRVVLDRKMLKKAVAAAGRFETDIFHLSCHGDETGIQLADGEELGWEELADELTPLASRSRILVNSSCVGGHSGIAKAFRATSNRFGYICGSTRSTEDDGVGYHDACLAWSILYNVLANRQSRSRAAFQDAIDKINAVVAGDFVYRRWDGKMRGYRSYPARAGVKGGKRKKPPRSPGTA